MTTNWIYASVQSLLQALQNNSISSRELLELYISRIGQKNSEINAVVAMNLDAARKRADAADVARANGELWGPLHGLPMTVKDTYEVPGMPCTAGAPMYRNHLPEKSAAAVQKLQDAGAIIFGKTNVPLFASDLQSYNKIYGTTNNPWNKALTPGGSSGGAAAALAAGFTAAELGSDIGGSIRTPAHFCGVYGHKVTHGLISMLGHVPGPPGTLSEPDLAVAGPMARSAADLALLLDVLAGGNNAAPGWQVQLPEAKHSELKAFRVLFWVDDPLCEIDQRMLPLFTQLQTILQAHDVSVTVGSPAGYSLEKFYPLYLNLLGGVMGASQKKIARRGAGLAAPLIKKFGHYIAVQPAYSHFMQGMAQSHADWLRISEQRMRLAQKFQQVFQQYDVILMPVAPATALKHQQQPELPFRKIVVNNQKRDYADMFPWIAPATLLGLPATSAPIGLTADGLPTNVQIVGASMQDKTTIKFAELLSEIMGGFVVPPGFV